MTTRRACPWGEHRGAPLKAPIAVATAPGASPARPQTVASGLSRPSTLSQPPLTRFAFVVPSPIAVEPAAGAGAGRSGSMSDSGSAWLRPSATPVMTDSSAYRWAEPCALCRAAKTCTPCFHCEKSACETCSRQCQACHEVFCVFCSTVNYDTQYDRSLCLSCNEEHARSVAPTTPSVGFGYY